MTIIGHLVRKDFALLRGRLALWAAFAAAKFALGFWLVLRAEVTDADIGWLQGLVAMFVVTDVALTLVCTLVLVQEDGVAGTQAWWRTRPIGGGRLLAAKVAAAMLLLVLPAVALAWPWWWVCGLTAAQTAVAAAQTAAWQAAVITVGFGAAAVSTTLGRAFVGLIAVGAGLVLANGALSTVFLQGAGVPVQAALWQLPVLLPVLAGAAAVSFFTRDARHGKRLIAGGVAVVLAAPVALAAGWVRWPERSDARAEPPAVAGAGNRAVQVTWTSATMRAVETGRSQAWMVQLGFNLSGVPADRLVGGEVWHEWRRADGVVQRAHSGLGGAAGGGLAVQAVRAPERPAKPGEPRSDQVVRTTAWLTPQQATWLQSGQMDYRARLRIHLVRAEVAVVAPAAGGAWQARHGHGGRVVEIERKGTERKVQVLESEPLDAWQELRREGLRTGDREMAKTYVVHNPGRAYATTSWGATRPAVTIGGVALRVRTLDLFNPTEERDGQRVAKYADWVETTAVAAVLFPQTETMEREIEVKGMKVGDR